MIDFVVQHQKVFSSFLVFGGFFALIFAGFSLDDPKTPYYVAIIVFLVGLIFFVVFPSILWIKFSPVLFHAVPSIGKISVRWPRFVFFLPIALFIFIGITAKVYQSQIGDRFFPSKVKLELEIMVYEKYLFRVEFYRNYMEFKEQNHREPKPNERAALFKRGHAAVDENLKSGSAKAVLESKNFRKIANARDKAYQTKSYVLLGTEEGGRKFYKPEDSEREVLEYQIEMELDRELGTFEDLAKGS